jgi:hypothetical protein
MNDVAMSTYPETLKFSTRELGSEYKKAVGKCHINRLILSYLSHQPFAFCHDHDPKQIGDMLTSLHRTPAYSIVAKLLQLEAKMEAVAAITPLPTPTVLTTILASPLTTPMPSITPASIPKASTTAPLTVADVDTLTSKDLVVDLSTILLLALPSSIWSSWSLPHQQVMTTFIKDNRMLLSPLAMAEVNALEIQISELTNPTTSCSPLASSSLCCGTNGSRCP